VCIISSVACPAENLQAVVRNGLKKKKKRNLGAPGWLIWWRVRLLISAQLLISGSWV